MHALQHLGFDDWFESQLTKFDKNEFSPARIIQVNKDNYIIKKQTNRIMPGVKHLYLLIDNDIIVPCTRPQFPESLFHPDFNGCYLIRLRLREYHVQPC